MKTAETDRTLSKSHKWLIFAFAASLMLSPEMLSRVGIFYGRAGIYGFFLVGLSLMLYIQLLSQFQDLSRQYTDPAPNDHLFKNVLGPITSFFPLSTKIIALLFLATGLLVSSGFVFNEVFVYWFPNFGFAFILLICLVVLQWFRQKTVFMLQILFCGLTVAGLLILTISGFLQTSIYNGLNQPQLISTDLLSIDILFIPVLFFLGMDLALIHLNNGHPPLSFKPINNTIAIAGLFFIFWGLIALGYVPLEKLSQTTISHILIAKSVLGGTGRYIMGIVVISGTLAAIHALLTVIKTQTRILLKQQGVKHETVYPILLILILGITIGILMARGLAGYDLLESFITGALILWLISYAWVPLLNFIAAIRYPERLKQRFSILLFKQLLVFLPIGLSVMIFIISSKEPVILLKFIGIALIVSLMIGAVLNLRTRHLTK